VFVCCFVCGLERGAGYSLIGGDVIIVCMIVAVCILSVLFLTMAATVFCEAPRDMRDVFCFLAMLAFCVIVVLVFVVKGL
jgi:hypothetical protein